MADKRLKRDAPPSGTRVPVTALARGMELKSGKIERVIRSVSCQKYHVTTTKGSDHNRKTVTACYDPAGFAYIVSSGGR